MSMSRTVQCRSLTLSCKSCKNRGFLLLWKKKFKGSNSSSTLPSPLGNFITCRDGFLCLPQGGLFQHESAVVGRDCHVWQISEAHLSPSRKPPHLSIGLVSYMCRHLPSPERCHQSSLHVSSSELLPVASGGLFRVPAPSCHSLWSVFFRWRESCSGKESPLSAYVEFPRAV